MQTSTQDNHWYEYPERWVDAVDIQLRGKASVDILRDMIVKRNTEYSRFKKLFLRAMSNAITLLPRQQIVIDLANQARQMGITETTYIAENLGINRHSAYKALKRAEDRLIIITYQNDEKMETYGDSIPFDDESRIEIEKRDIKRVYAGMIIDCPGNGANLTCLGSARVRYGLCSECAQEYGRHQEDRPEWLQKLVRLVQRQMWSEAKDIVFRRKYGTNLDITEVA